MEEKYYTPKIEEFHVGFEFEYNNKHNGWEKDSMKFPNNYAFLFDVRTHEDIIRVKYLDREDIESLGWELDQTVKGDSFFYHKNYNMMSEIEPCLCFTPKQEMNIHIYDVSSPLNTKDYTALLKIKNKSELKKLMKQLNILCDDL